jgi:hypothetical protein
MAIEKTRAQIVGSIWQAIAQSDVDLTSIPHAQQEQLVNKITDNVMMAMDAMLDDFSESQPEGEPSGEEVEGDEKVLWKGRPFMSLVANYVITSERIKVIRGLLSRDVENFELIRVQDIDFNQGVSERMLGIGDITIQGQDPSQSKLTLRNVKKPEQVYEILRKAWLDARKRYGLQFREYM